MLPLWMCGCSLQKGFISNVTFLGENTTIWGLHQKIKAGGEKVNVRQKFVPFSSFPTEMKLFSFESLS